MQSNEDNIIQGRAVHGTSANRKILIIDDDLYIRDLYEEVLRDDGFNVETAVDGEEGLMKLQKGGYDLVLLDVMMPKRDGLGVLSELALHPPLTPNGPIIVLTNLGHDPIIKEAMSKGAASYLNKADMTPDQLLANIKKFL
jgi:CheY-like chemotaxis protein